MKYKRYVTVMALAALLLTGCQQTQTTTPEHDSSTNTTATKQDSNTRTLTEPQTSAPDTTPLTNIVRCNQIHLPDDISVCNTFKRTADGFSCIVRTMNNQLAYLHISEDMQTSKASVLEMPYDQGDYSPSYQWFALEDGGAWAIVIMESHGDLKPFDPQKDGDNYDFESWNAAKQERCLLCHYNRNGKLVSTIHATELEDYQRLDSGSLGNVNDFECVDAELYITLFDGRIVQIDKETAKVTLVSDLREENTSYNQRILCFDRDDKPVLLQKKTGDSAPNTPTKINDVTISEFDLASSSCGQTIYTIGDNWGKTYFNVLKGYGEYRLFVIKFNELIGIKDDGTQESLIDIDASDLKSKIMKPNDYPVPYTDHDLFEIQIMPVDNTRFLGLYLHYPDYKTDAYCLTRKHESEIS